MPTSPHLQLRDDPEQHVDVCEKDPVGCRHRVMRANRQPPLARQQQREPRRQLSAAGPGTRAARDRAAVPKGRQCHPKHQHRVEQCDPDARPRDHLDPRRRLCRSRGRRALGAIVGMP
eukprot:152570-Chlamydomonas_euryale.AAC.1